MRRNSIEIREFKARPRQEQATHNEVRRAICEVHFTRHSRSAFRSCPRHDWSIMQSARLTRFGNYKMGLH
jgi:hypothetical protein